MNLFLTLAYLFFLGSLFGWVLELLFRRFFSSANPERRWINPGFCVGPYVPIYGFGLCILYLIAVLGLPAGTADTPLRRGLLFLGMAVSMTAIEYITGLAALKWLKLRLWDYSGEWGNVQGIICPKFSFFWALMGAAYYFLIHPRILRALAWLSENLAFSFVIGFFFGVFIIDVCYSAHIVTLLKRFAAENDVIIRYERLKAHLHSMRETASERHSFLFAFRADRTPLQEHLRAAKAALEKPRERLAERIRHKK